LSFTTFREDDVRPPEQIADAISTAVGSSQYVRSHRYGDLCFQTSLGRSPRLAVSRYYWDLEPPVVVDFRRELRYGQLEVDTKQAYFREHGIRYYLASDEWDEDAIRSTPTSSDAAVPLVQQQRPVTAARPSKSA
jgi:hypothetical protein